MSYSIKLIFQRELTKALKLDIRENRTLAGIAAIAFSDVGDLKGDEGGFIGARKLKAATCRAIMSVKYKRYRERKTDGGIVEVEIT